MLDRSGIARAFAEVGVGPTDETVLRDDIPPVTSFSEFGEPAAGPFEDPVAASLGEWDAGDVTELPGPREWLLGNQFCRRFLSGILAPGATGKTALRTLQYLAVATGRPLTGQHVFRRGRVLLLSLEDDDNELKRRLAAARIHHGIDAADLKGWLFCATPKGIKLADIKDGARVRGRWRQCYARRSSTGASTCSGWILS